MSNSQIITHNFEFIQPANLKEALEALGKGKAKALAGGTDLVNRLKDGREKPDTVVYIGRLPELTAIDDGEVLVLGSCVPHERHRTAPGGKALFPRPR